MSSLVSESSKDVKKRDSFQAIKVDKLLTYVDNSIINWTRNSNRGQQFTVQRIKDILRYILSNEDVLLYNENCMRNDKKWKTSLKDMFVDNDADDCAEEGKLMDRKGKAEELNKNFQEEEGELVSPLTKYSVVKVKSPLKTFSPKQSAYSEKHDKSNKNSLSAFAHSDRSSHKNSPHSSYTIPRYSQRQRNEPLSAIEQRAHGRYRNRIFYSPRKAYIPKYKYSPSKLLCDRIVKYDRTRKSLEKRERSRSPRRNNYNERLNPVHSSRDDGSTKRTSSTRYDSSPQERQRSSKMIRSSERSPNNKPTFKDKTSSHRQSRDLTHSDVKMAKDNSPNHEESHQVQKEQSRTALYSESQTEKVSDCETVISKLLPQNMVSKDYTYKNNDKISSSETVQNVQDISTPNKDSVMAKALNRKEKSQSCRSSSLAEEKQQTKKNIPVSCYMETVGDTEKKQVSDTGECLTTKKHRSPRKPLSTSKFVKSTSILSGTDSMPARSTNKEHSPSRMADETVMTRESPSPKKRLPTFRFVKSTSSHSESDRKADETVMTKESPSPKKLPPTFRFVKSISGESMPAENNASTEKEQSSPNVDENVMMKKNMYLEKQLSTSSLVETTSAHSGTVKTDSILTGSNEKKHLPSKGDKIITKKRAQSRKSTPTFKFIRKPSISSELIPMFTENTKKEEVLSGDAKETMKTAESPIPKKDRPTFKFVKSSKHSGTDSMSPESEENIKKQSPRNTQRPMIKNKVSPRRSLPTFLQSIAAESSYFISSTSESDKEEVSKDIVQSLVTKKKISKHSWPTSNCPKTTVTNAELRVTAENIEKNKIPKDVAASSVIRITQNDESTNGKLPSGNMKCPVIKGKVRGKKIRPNFLQEKRIQSSYLSSSTSESDEEQVLKDNVQIPINEKRTISKNSLPTSNCSEVLATISELKTTVENTKKSKFSGGVVESPKTMTTKSDESVKEKQSSRNTKSPAIKSKVTGKKLPSNILQRKGIPRSYLSSNSSESDEEQVSEDNIHNSIINEKAISQNSLPTSDCLKTIATVSELKAIVKNTEENKVPRDVDVSPMTKITESDESIRRKQLPGDIKCKIAGKTSNFLQRKGIQSSYLSFSSSESDEEQALEDNIQNPIIEKRTISKNSLPTSNCSEVLATISKLKTTVGNTEKGKFPGDIDVNPKAIVIRSDEGIGEKQSPRNTISPAIISKVTRKKLPSNVLQRKGTLCHYLSSSSSESDEEQVEDNIYNPIIEKRAISQNSLPTSDCLNTVAIVSELKTTVENTEENKVPSNVAVSPMTRITGGDENIGEKQLSGNVRSKVMGKTLLPNFFQRKGQSSYLSSSTSESDEAQVLEDNVQNAMNEKKAISKNALPTSNCSEVVSTISELKSTVENTEKSKFSGDAAAGPGKKLATRIDENIRKKQSSRNIKVPVLKIKVTGKKFVSNFLKRKSNQSSYSSSSTSESDEEQVSKDNIHNSLIKKKIISKNSLSTSDCLKIVPTVPESKATIENTEENKAPGGVAASSVIKEITPQNLSCFSMPPKIVETSISIENKHTTDAIKGLLIKDGMSLKNPLLIPRTSEMVATATRAIGSAEGKQKSKVVKNLEQETPEKSFPVSSFVESVKNIEEKQALENVKSSMERSITPEKLSTSMPMETVEITSTVAETTEITATAKETPGVASILTETIEHTMKSKTPGRVKGSLIMKRVIPKNPLPIFTPIETVRSALHVTETVDNIKKQSLDAVKNPLIKEKMADENSTLTSRAVKTADSNSMNSLTIENTKEKQTSQNVSKSFMMKGKRKISGKLLHPSAGAETVESNEITEDADKPVGKKRVVTSKKPLPTSLPIDTVDDSMLTEVMGNISRKRTPGGTKGSAKKKMKILHSSLSSSNHTETVQSTSVPTETVESTSVPTETVESTSVPTETIESTSVPTETAESTSVLTETVESTSVPTETVESTSASPEAVRIPSIPTQKIETTSISTETVEGIKRRQSLGNEKRAITKEKPLSNKCKLPLKKTSKTKSVINATIKESKSPRTCENVDKLKLHKMADVQNSLAKSISSSKRNVDVSKSHVKNASVGNNSTKFKNEQETVYIISSKEEKQEANTNAQSKSSVEMCLSGRLADASATSSGAKTYNLNSKIYALQERRLPVAKEYKNGDKSRPEKITECANDGNVSDDSTDTSDDSTSASDDSTSASDDNNEESNDSILASDGGNEVLDDSTAASHGNKSKSLDGKMKLPDDGSPLMDSQLNSAANTVTKSPHKVSSIPSEDERRRKPDVENKLKTAAYVTASPAKEESKQEEVIETWTREVDREILLTCKILGCNQLAFEKAANAVNRKPEQVEKRFYHLLNVFSKKMKECKASS